MTARDEDTFAMAKMVFDDTPTGYENADNASLLATARRYRPPEVARRIATSSETGVVRQRQSLPLDPHAPDRPPIRCRPTAWPTTRRARVVGDGRAVPVAGRAR